MKNRPLTVLSLVFVAAMVGCGGGSGGGEKAKATGPEVVLKNIRFRPTKMSVKVGGEVTWVFEDKGIPHNVTASDGSFRSENKAEGTFAHRFTTPGSFSYTCTLHPAQMRGSVEVRA